MTSGTANNQAASEALARFVVEWHWEDLPQKVIHEAKRSLLNFFATALGGCRDEAIELALKTLLQFSGSREAAIIGRSERTDPLTAAFLNAASANVFDFDDTHVPTIIHPTAPVAPALFALAAMRGIRGRDLLLAFVLGVEVECRIGNAVSPSHYRRGWHITATCGVFGAAAAVAKILDLEVRQTLWAFGNASAQASGLVETLGSMAKSIGVGNAARNGMLAALLAEQGFYGPERPIDGPRGFATVTSDEPDLSRITEGLGASWELLRNTYKPYPCGVVLNPVVDACLDLRRQQKLPAAQIRRIVVAGPPLLRQRTDRPDIRVGREAQVSAQHTVAVILLRGDADIAQYSDAAVADTAVGALRKKVSVEEDADMPAGSARVTIETTEGLAITAEVMEARGSLERPMTDVELEQKLKSLADYGSPGLNPAPLIEALDGLENRNSVRDVIELSTKQ